jgi:enediyne biosynthesis protein E4
MAIAAIIAASPTFSAMQAPGPWRFRNVTTSSGISFRHQTGAAEKRYYYPELFGGGVAVLDVDGDRWPDLLFVNGRDWKSDSRSRHGLYRNNRDGTFRDIAAGSGLAATFVYGMGAAVADYDNDGRDDVFMTGVEGGRLFHNEGAGRFTDVSDRAGVASKEFSVSAAWLDYDRDGLVDLFIGNYVQWSPALEVSCTLNGEAGYCGPDAYKPRAPQLFRNLGAGRFEDATARAGLNSPTDKAMGVAILDYDGDGWPDIFVGSDRVPAKLYRNDGRGHFVDEAIRAGVALSENGVARANMGVDAADYDRSGRPHLVVGNFLNEMLGLYHNDNGRTFTDVAPRSEVGRSSLLSVTWAVSFLDADLDGFLDIFAVNGGTDESQGMDARARLSQPPLLLRNRGDRSFENVTSRLGPEFGEPIMGRGAAGADFDGDGDLDLVVTTLGGPPIVFRNDRATASHWLRVRAVGSKSNRSGIGAIVRVTTSSGSQWQMVHSGSGYASQNELTLTFGLGEETRVAALEVEWPSGAKQRFADVPVDRLVAVDETSGLQLSAAASRPPGSGAAAPPR